MKEDQVKNYFFIISVKGILKDEVSNDALAYGIHGLWTGTTGVCC